MIELHDKCVSKKNYWKNKFIIELSRNVTAIPTAYNSHISPTIDL